MNKTKEVLFKDIPIGMKFSYRSSAWGKVLELEKVSEHSARQDISSSEGSPFGLNVLVTVPINSYQDIEEDKEDE